VLAPAGSIHLELAAGLHSKGSSESIRCSARVPATRIGFALWPSQTTRPRTATTKTDTNPNYRKTRGTSSLFLLQPCSAATPIYEFDAAETGLPVVCPSESESFTPNRLKRPSRRPEITPGCAQHRERLAGTSELRLAIPLLAAVQPTSWNSRMASDSPKGPPRKLS